nr:DHA2 family efflux MFS transporter permease subunit [uncultured Desulfuromonas sp.]
MQDNAPKVLPPLSGGRLVLATASLSLATFMNVLDTTITNVSIPAISGNLGVSTNQGTWVITFFAVANALAVPLTGWLTRRIGQIRLFISALLMFILASLLCGLAWNLEALITFRILQGFAVGPIIPLSMSLLLQCYPRQKAGLALALWSMTVTVAPIAGPILGGWLTDNASWPWIFYINLPIGLLTTAVIWAVLKDRETPTAKLPVDKTGLFLLMLWVGCFQVMLDKGHELDWFGSPFVVALAVISVIGFCYFLVWELTVPHPVVDLSLFKNRNFALSTLSLSLGYGVFFMNLVLTPLWLQRFMGYTATWAGLVTAPFGIFAVILAPAVGKNLHRVDPRLFVTGAFSFFSLAFYLRSQFTPDVSAGTIALNHLLQGIGMAAFMTPLNAMAVSQLPQERIPSASGLLNFARIMLGAFAASIGTTLWEDRAILHHAQLSEHITGYANAVIIARDKLLTMGMAGMKSLGLINMELTKQAYTLSAMELYRISSLLFLILISVIWLARPDKEHRP